MMYWRRILIPFSWIFYGIIRFRNFLYDQGILKSHTYKKAMICIGNIRVGGTGKSPFTEFLIQFLGRDYHLAVLSRGYGRKTRGFLEVDYPNSLLFGDEPSQFKARFPQVKIFVSENRKKALDYMIHHQDLVLLDDAFQHRKIRAGMNWVLLEYSDLSKPFYLIPAGNYREGISGLKRADCILITKCKGNIGPEEVEIIRYKLKLSHSQELFFSSIQYLPMERLLPIRKTIRFGQEENLDHKKEENFLKPGNFENIVAFSGIGNPVPFEEYLKQTGMNITFLTFPDHHIFNQKEIRNIQDKFDKIISHSKILLTTEKDVQRLRHKDFESFIHEYPVYFQPIRFQIQNHESDKLKELILHYVESTL